MIEVNGFLRLLPKLKTKENYYISVLDFIPNILKTPTMIKILMRTINVSGDKILYIVKIKATKIIKMRKKNI